MRADGFGSQPSVRALERAIEILDCFQGASAPVPLTAIASKVDLSPTTALRILGTLEKKGYIVRDENTKRYSLGPNLLGLTSAAQRMNSLAPLALPFMQELNAQFDETISVYIVSGVQRVCIQRVDSSHPLRQVISIGDILPLSIGAGGKVLAAWLALSPSFDPSSLVPPLMPALLEQVRQSGYATSFNERGEGIYGVAAPIRNWTGDVTAALSLSGPTARFVPEKLTEMAEAIMEKAQNISKAQGWNPERNEDYFSEIAETKKRKSTNVAIGSA